MNLPYLGGVNSGYSFQRIFRSWVIPVLMLLCGGTRLSAQYGREWINYNQTYWKFPVVRDGLYTIGFESLQQAGFPVSSVDPDLIQVFGREQQMRIRVAGGEDGSFDPGDYIELFGMRNDGWLDSLAYESPSSMGNPHYSLFNDTLNYFITVGNIPGKRTGNQVFQDPGNGQPALWCWFRSLREYHDEYIQGRLDQNGIGLPSYGRGEGWMSYRFSKGTALHTDLSTTNAYNGPGAPQAYVNAAAAGASLAAGNPNHHLQVGWGNSFNLMVDTSYYGYQLHQTGFPIPASGLGTSFTRITHRSIDDLGVAVDNHSVAWASVRYAHNWDFSDYEEGREFRVSDDDGDGIIYFALSDLSLADPRFFVMSHDIMTELQPAWDGTFWKCTYVMNEEEEDARIRIYSASSPLTNIERATASGLFTPYHAQQTDSAFVLITHPSLWNAALTYAAYRQQSGLNVLQVNVEELYLQYGGGIRKNPLAIARFCEDLVDNWESQPSHLFLVGKSIHEMAISANQGARNNPSNYARNLIPTWGWPSSDLMFTSRMNAPLYHAGIPTGRLSAETSEEVLEYLNKVIEHEDQPPAAWQKNVMHFGGGGNAYEQHLFQNYLLSYEHIVEDTSFAAETFTFLKNTTDPIQLDLSDSIQYLINQGVSLMTFFGHASSTGFDQNIDSPQSYSNQGKYPLLIGNSCYTGNIHLEESQSTSEEFVLVPNRGVIGFLAKSDLGIPVYLDLFTNGFYRHLFQENYGRSIGQCMVESVRDFELVGDFYRENTALTFALHGDPAVRLFAWDKPDYQITPSDIRFNPAQVTAQADDFQVKVFVHNIGKAVHHPVGIELIRHYPSGVDSSYSLVLDEILHADSVVFTLPIDPVNGTGQNFFDVFVDYPASLIEELDDVTNNVVMNVPLFIASGDLIPVYPYAFAVIPVDTVTLSASTGYVLEPEQTYIIQVDTTDRFDSPWMMQQSFTESGGVVRWTLPVNLTDSTVYFWRCSSDSLDPEHPFRWRMSSFQYIEGRSGWGQDHFFQFESDPMSGLEYDRQSRSWSFSPVEGNLACQVYGNPSTQFEALGTRYQIQLDVQDYSGPGYVPALMVAVVDPVSLEPWESNFNGTNPGHDFGNTMASAIARNRPEKYFIFQQNDPEQLSGFADMITNHIPDDHYLLIYTWMYRTLNTWTSLAPEVYEAFEAIGAQLATQGNDSVPYIFFMQNGHPETMVELIGNVPDDNLTLNVPLITNTASGLMRSPPIGPAFNWNLAEWDFDGQEAVGDEIHVKLSGVGNSGNETLIWESSGDENELSDLGTVANPAIFPQLKIQASLVDTVNQTSGQTDRWHVFFDPAPEAALEPTLGYYFSTDTLNEGQMLDFAMAVLNISPVDMDSLLVNYWIEDAQRVRHPIDYPRQDSLLSGALLLDTIHFVTLGLEGWNTLVMEVNPPSSGPGGYDQLEQFHFNNIVQVPFFVETDQANPILDVTFDGQHILNRDIVSAEPLIVVQLDDENTFLLLDSEADTSFFRMFISEPGKPSRPLHFAEPEIEWFPATDSRNKSRIEYRPRFTADGLHTLIVQASDKTGNSSGTADYKVNFEVVNRPSITGVLNYPNPFSTSTRFVFTLTGSEVPDQMKIQIMTIGGSIVREITQDEIGPLRIGRNMTEFAWNGADEYGDPLANGVYLYRVVARLNGETVENRESGADAFITKGFGKMYLMR